MNVERAVTRIVVAISRTKKATSMLQQRGEEPSHPRVFTTVFCQCEGAEFCKNHLTQHLSEEDDSEMATEETDETLYLDALKVTFLIYRH